jgi:cystathionine beta-lyase
MAAVAAITRLLRAGDEVLASDDLYGGTFRLLGRVLPRMGIGVRLVDATDPAAVKAALGEKTKLIVVETPSNPRMRICDLKALAEVAHARGAWLAVDNSLLSPVHQQPLLHGADIVVHSGTKALGGHSDATAGAIVVDDDGLAEEIGFFQNAEGSALAPFESWLLLRGIKTLALRVERSASSALEIAQWLRRQPGVEKVLYPGLPDHPLHAVHARQAKGGGPVISFTTGDADVSRRLVEATKVFAIAVSFGSVHSTLSLPLHMSHASTPQHLRRDALGGDLIRLSVGIEAPSDLVADLDQALASARVRRVVKAAP